MLKRLRFKASLESLPPLFPGGRRSVSEVASNFPFANGGEALKSRCYGGVDNSSISSEKISKISNTGQLRKLRSTMASSNHALAFPKEDVDTVANLNHSPALPVGDHDEFAELGPSVSPGMDSGFDLANDKHKDTNSLGTLLKNGSQQPRGTSQMQDSHKSFTRIPQSQDKREPGIRFNLQCQNGGLRIKTEADKQKYTAENNQGHSGSPFILIDNIPRGISIQDLRGAVSAYGEILSAYMKPGQDGLGSFNVRFKSKESKKKALAAQWITVKNSRFPVRGQPTLKYVPVRITNISVETAEPAIHATCMSSGCVVGLTRTKEGAVDVLFRVNDESMSESIVKQLSDVFIDDCRWSAQLIPKLDNKLSNFACGTRSVESEISKLLRSFRKQFHMQRIYLEDLENLHHAVLHLRDTPPEFRHS